MASKQRIIGIVLLGIFMVSLAAVVYQKASNYVPIEQRVRTVCQQHGGVAQIPDNTSVVVCKDGWAGEY